MRASAFLTSGVLVLASLVTIGWTIRVGHSGAEATWSAVIESTDRTQGS